MSWTEHETDIPTKLFATDSGELEMNTRRTFIQLLMGPSIDGQRHTKLWTTLLKDEAIIRSRLSELFLELVIDRELQIAFTRQAETEDLEVPILLRRAQLTYIDSILLLYLRQRLTQADAEGERAVISVEEVQEYLALYERDNSTDRAGFKKRIQASIEKFKKHNVLQKIRTSENRLEISPTLKLLFSAEEVNALTQLYQCMVTNDKGST